MRYLLYYHRGFIKKFPLPGGPVVIGRERGRDLVVDDGGLSRRHCQAEVYEDRLLVRPQLRHGLWVDGVAVGEAAIRPPQHSFILGTPSFSSCGATGAGFGESRTHHPGLHPPPAAAGLPSPTRTTPATACPLLQTLAARAFISADPEDLLLGLSAGVGRLVPQGSLMLCRDQRRKVLFDHQSLSAAEQEQVAEAAAPWAPVGGGRTAPGLHRLVIHHPSPAGG